MIPSVNYTEVNGEMIKIVCYDEDDDTEDFLDECEDTLEDYA